MINWVELSVSSCHRRSSCHMGQVVSWVEFFVGRVVTRVELCCGSRFFFKVDLSQGSSCLMGRDDLTPYIHVYTVDVIICPVMCPCCVINSFT